MRKLESRNEGREAAGSREAGEKKQSKEQKWQQRVDQVLRTLEEYQAKLDSGVWDDRPDIESLRYSLQVNKELYESIQVGVDSFLAWYRVALPNIKEMLAANGRNFLLEVLDFPREVIPREMNAKAHENFGTAQRLSKHSWVRRLAKLAGKPMPDFVGPYRNAVRAEMMAIKASGTKVVMALGCGGMEPEKQCFRKNQPAVLIGVDPASEILDVAEKRMTKNSRQVIRITDPNQLTPGFIAECQRLAEQKKGLVTILVQAEALAVVQALYDNGAKINGLTNTRSVHHFDHQREAIYALIPDIVIDFMVEHDNFNMNDNPDDPLLEQACREAAAIGDPFLLGEMATSTARELSKKDASDYAASMSQTLGRAKADFFEDLSYTIVWELKANQEVKAA